MDDREQPERCTVITARGIVTEAPLPLRGRRSLPDVQWGGESMIVRRKLQGADRDPVAVRRRLGLKTGQPLAIRALTQGEILLSRRTRGMSGAGSL